MYRRFFARLALGAVAAVLLAGCAASDTRFYLGAFEQNADLRELFRLFNREKDQENRFVLIQQIASTLENSGQRDKEILFLTTHVEKNPADIYNGYYLVLVADTYRDMGAAPMAIHYYRRVLANNVDLLVGNRSIHFHSLQELLKLDTNPENKIEYYKELISRWPEPEQGIGSNWYYMAKAYEQVGEWEQAIQAYVKFTYSADTDIPGDPRAYRTAEEKIGYYSPGVDKTWMMPDLPTLVGAVRDAIVTKNVVKLMRYEAKVNFFQEPWDQTTLQDEQLNYNIAQYLPISGVRIEGDLDIAANDREAYLKTTGWNFRPPTWYLYFRKIDFPANPDINGQWEWAGIYFGEKL